MSMSEPFGMILARRPVSGNKTNSKYQSEVAGAARNFSGDRAPLTGALYSRIIWFHRVRQVQDVDNIPKQILDSLKQRVYEDDRLVRQCLVTDIDVRQEYELLPERISDQ